MMNPRKVFPVVKPHQALNSTILIIGRHQTSREIGLNADLNSSFPYSGLAFVVGQKKYGDKGVIASA